MKRITITFPDEEKYEEIRDAAWKARMSFSAYMISKVTSKTSPDKEFTPQVSPTIQVPIPSAVRKPEPSPLDELSRGIKPKKDKSYEPIYSKAYQLRKYGKK